MSCQSNYMINMSFMNWLDYLIRMKEFRNQQERSNMNSFNVKQKK